jgi:Zn-finger nucleic acid-binding protein
MSKNLTKEIVNSDEFQYGKCPECGHDWDGGDILEHFMDAKNNPEHKQHDYYKDKTDAEIKDISSNYGYTSETPRRFSHIIGVELSYDDPRHYDGISIWMCPNCRVGWNRFTGEYTDEFVNHKWAKNLTKDKE